VQSVRFSDFEGQAEYIDDLMAQIAPDGAHLVGHSFGGRLSASFALPHPEDVPSPTLLQPALTFAGPPLGMLAWTGATFILALREPAAGQAGLARGHVHPWAAGAQHAPGPEPERREALRPRGPDGADDRGRHSELPSRAAPARRAHKAGDHRSGGPHVCRDR